MKPRPAFSMYAAEFFSDTAALSQAEVGALVRIMCQYWRHGALPDNLEAWALGEVTDAVCMHVTVEVQRLDELRAECEALSEARAKAARGRWDKPEPMPKVKPFTAEIWPTFGDWWEAYGKKVDRAKCERKWASLTQNEREQAYRHTEAYVIATPDVQYRRHPATYLNNANWNDEELTRPRTQGGSQGHRSLTFAERVRAAAQAATHGGDADDAGGGHGS